MGVADKDTKAVQTDSSGEFSAEQINYVYENRRYVGRKETIAYVMFDMAQSININKYSGRFVNNILQIDFSLQQLATFINGIWDIINDIFTGAIVDKTRTRWGKFKPYLIGLGIPGTMGAIIYWLMPLFFPQTGPKDLNKFLMYLILAVVREGVDTFRGIAQTGMLATITPHPVDRTRLITIANFASSFLGEKLPEQIMTLLLDLIGNGIIKSETKSITQIYTSLFVSMGVITSIISGAFSLYFFFVTRERVLQSVKKPSVMQGIKSILNNKPILLLTLSQTLSGLSVGGGKQDYFIDVLNFATLAAFTGLPGSIVHPISYSLVPWFRRKFSSRTLYILGAYIGDILMVPVFFVGAIGGKKNGLYKKIIPMAIALTVWETVFMLFYGVRKVIPSELYNEAMDYCEWKNGYRTEAMTSVAKGLATKLASLFSNMVQLQIKKLIKYDQTLYISGKQQSDDTKFGLFAMFTIVPFATTSLGIIPMLFYDLGGEKRERMYAELLARRAEMSQSATSGSAEDLERLAEMQMKVGEKNKNKEL